MLEINHMKTFFQDRMKTAPCALYIQSILKNYVIFQLIRYIFLVPIFAQFLYPSIKKIILYNYQMRITSSYIVQ